MNTQKLQQIDSFFSFINFLENPQEYRDLINEVKNAVKEHERVVHEQRKIFDIDVWRAQESKKYQEMLVKVKSDSEKFDLDKKDLEIKQQEFEEKKQEQKEMMSKVREELKQRELILGDLSLEKNKLMEQSKRMVEKERLLDEMKKDLAAKQDALNQIFQKGR